ncbi:MAG TPA: DUF4365 domain-containing protein [Puia sp.]|jgi:hypothetical protein|nr:DUF4365 domain-containing protein [Puia sp.]
MAFFEDPQVDEASKRSDESVTALISIFSEENGFICRPVIPDTGVDFQVELIAEGRSRNSHFGVQLKSVRRLETISGGTMITYPFKTSRLGYLARQVPNLGMVVIYDYNSKECFYDRRNRTSGPLILVGFDCR